MTASARGVSNLARRRTGHESSNLARQSAELLIIPNKGVMFHKVGVYRILYISIVCWYVNSLLARVRVVSERLEEYASHLAGGAYCITDPIFQYSYYTKDQDKECEVINS